jgi:NAD(P)-dependent dehydrogenase (short-subunit alcohol dehydrogenase family)
VAGERPDERTELLGTCARLWEQGVPVRTRTAGRLITLPGYPFQRRAYWPEPGAPAPVRPAVPAEPADICYTPAWRHEPVRLPVTIDLPGPLVVFTDVQLYLADEVRSQVVEVLPGADIKQAFAGLAPDGPLHVAYLRSVSGGLGSSVDELLGVVHALGELGREARLLTATAGAVEVLGGDAIAPLQAAAHGIGRVVQHEYPGITWTGVDLDPAAPATAAQLAAELTRPADPRLPLAGWRRGRRWVKDWAELDVTPTDSDTPWRADGVYLVTGGTRGLGMALARHIADHGVRGLVLVGRTPQSELSEQVRNDIEQLRATGVEVLPLTADAGDPDALRAAIDVCRERFGALTGVVHAAGVPAGGMLQRRTVADVRGVLAPKLGPLDPFAELLREPQPPELLVLYSSAVTAFGGIGEGDYCAANTVLDAWAEAHATPNTRVLSVAWGPWRHDDWQSQSLQGSALAERVRGYRERYGFTDTDGCALLDRLLHSGHSNVLAVRQSMDDALRDWSAMLDLDELTGATALPAAERFPRPKLRTEFVAPRSELEETIAEVWQTYLGIDRVGVHDPFFDLGGNSLVGMTMVRAVEQRLDTQIAPAVLFEHPTVAAFAAALQGPASGAPTTPDVLTTSSARGQRRRRARATRGNEDRS